MNCESWRPQATVQALQQRAELVWTIRKFFRSAGYAEVHTPTLSRDTVVDRYIDPIIVPGAALNCAQAAAARYYLQTSPEFCMKRLVAAGMNAIYQLGPAYRAGERGTHHNPEFTMLEWYRVGESLAQSLKFLVDLVEQVLGGASLPAARAEVVTYEAVFESLAGLNPLTCSAEQLQAFVQRQGWQLGSSWSSQSRDDWLNLIFAECIQPQLGFETPVLVTHYPATQAALAKVCSDDPRTAERYELFIRGVEIANGYHELLDAAELVGRSREVLSQRRSDGKPDLPLDNQLLAAMHAGLPDCCGCALGVDRLVMIALQKETIDQVIPFSIEHA